MNKIDNYWKFNSKQKIMSKSMLRLHNYNIKLRSRDNSIIIAFFLRCKPCQTYNNINITLFVA